MTNKISFQEMRRSYKKFPVKKETKEQRVARKQHESIAMERKQRLKLGKPSSDSVFDKVSDRLPINKQSRIGIKNESDWY